MSTIHHTLQRPSRYTASRAVRIRAIPNNSTYLSIHTSHNPTLRADLQPIFPINRLRSLPLGWWIRLFFLLFFLLFFNVRIRIPNAGCRPTQMDGSSYSPILWHSLRRGREIHDLSAICTCHQGVLGVCPNLADTLPTLPPGWIFFQLIVLLPYRDRFL
jgi:hypothetical protein